MAGGFSSPMQASSKGRLVLSTGDQHIAELLGVAFGDGESNNPFQELGLGEYMIFDSPNEELFQDVTVKIKEIFDSFEVAEIAKLQEREDNLSIEPGVGEGAWEMRVYFINLERNAPGTFKLLGGHSEGLQIEVL